MLINTEIFDRIIKMKYTVPNDDFSEIDAIQNDIDEFYDNLFTRYEA